MDFELVARKRKSEESKRKTDFRDIYDGMQFQFCPSTIRKLTLCLQDLFGGNTELIIKNTVTDERINTCLWIIEDILHFVYYTVTESTQLKKLKTRCLLRCLSFCQALLLRANNFCIEGSHEDNRIEFYLRVLINMVSYA